MNGFGNVEGWCTDQVFETVELIDGLQSDKAGGCLEIGVHHGRLYILMNQVVAGSETSYAVDLFDNQVLNIDHSGHGAVDVFRGNLAKYDVHRGQNTTLVSGDSTDPSLGLETRIGLGTLRLISSRWWAHGAAYRLSDLALANRLVRNDGVVILDDILSYHWLGVIEGGLQISFYRPNLGPPLQSVTTSCISLKEMSYQQQYLRLFCQSPLMSKVVRFFGYDLAASSSASFCG